MNDPSPVMYVARHGETAWSVTGQHTGLTDLPLTEHGEHVTRWRRNRLNGRTFSNVFTSPLQRAGRTCELAGFDLLLKSIATWWSGTSAATAGRLAPNGKR